MKIMEAVSSKEFSQVLALISSMIKDGKTEELIRLLNSATESSENRRELIQLARNSSCIRSEK